MKRLLLPAIGLAAWLATGCSDDPTATKDTSAPVFSADQLLLIQPDAVADKHAATDEIDFSFDVEPGRKVNFNRPGFKIRVDRGDAPFDTTITGDWLGDNEPGYYGIDFGPEGFEWAEPINLEIKIPTSLIIEFGLDRLYIVLDLENGTYEPVPADWHVHGNHYWLDGEIEHFSKYLVAVGPPPDNNQNN